MQPKNTLIALVLASLTGSSILSCSDDDDNGYRGSNHPSGVGNFCQTDGDCPTGTCYIGPGGGYCTAPCSGEGQTSECPVDTVCKPIQGGARRCLLICGSDSSCRSSAECPDTYCPFGSQCVGVDNTDFQACEPDPV